jgi:hypothetical protein
MVDKITTVPKTRIANVETRLDVAEGGAKRFLQSFSCLRR